MKRLDTIAMLIAASGLIGALVAINFALVLLYLFSRHRRFIPLAMYVFLLTLAYSALLDSALNIWHLPSVALTDYWLWLMAPALLVGQYFSATSLNLHRHQPKLKKVFATLSALVFTTLLLYLVFDVAEMWVVSLYALQALGLAGIAMWSKWRLKVDIALWITGGWLAIFSACCFAISVFTGFRPNHESGSYVVMLGISVAGVAFWFIALSKQYLRERSRVLAEQHKALAELKANEKMRSKLLQVQEQAQEALEAKIQERTFELEIALRELQEANRELEEKNTQDALTGLKNRRFFDKKYLAEFRRSRRERSELSIVMLDIDHFKKVNDNYGHLAGDEVIRCVGRIIGDMLKRPSDAGCRYGGEEFALILPNTDTQGALQLAQRINERIEQTHITTDAGMIQITVSCGVYTNVAELEMAQNAHVEFADQALYCAKQTGRNRVVHYNQMPAKPKLAKSK